MIKNLTYLFTLIIALTTLIGCSDDEDIISETGVLIVNARDISGNSIIGENVYLYNNEADFNNVIYSESKVTDNSGQARFNNLNPGVYYVDCDFTNTLGTTTTIFGEGSVSAGFETTITIQP